MTSTPTTVRHDGAERSIRRERWPELAKEAVGRNVGT
jgi:hypothetical protein